MAAGILPSTRPASTQNCSLTCTDLACVIASNEDSAGLSALAASTPFACMSDAIYFYKADSELMWNYEAADAGRAHAPFSTSMGWRPATFSAMRLLRRPSITTHDLHARTT